MLYLILSAILFGIILSLIIGPVFFLLIETSITKGVKAAIALEIGILSSDIVYIIFGLFSSKPILKFLDSHPFIYIIGGAIVALFGIKNILDRPAHFKYGSRGINSKNLIITFLQGFFLNIINIGIFAFWLTIIVLISSKYESNSDLYTYLGILLLSMFVFDLFFKILLANSFQHKLTDTVIYKIKRIIGAILIVIGLYIVITTWFFPKNTSINNPKESQVEKIFELISPSN